jgi:hypothetical protein
MNGQCFLLDQPRMNDESHAADDGHDHPEFQDLLSQKCGSVS